MFGDWTTLTIFLYILGLTLLMIEGVIPGFGISGVLGIIFVTISVALITSSLYEALLMIIITIVLFITIIFLLYKLGYGSKYLKFLVLKTEKNNAAEYISRELDDSYIGKTGIAETILRPAGIVRLDGKRVNAQSQGEFIESGSKVTIIEIIGMKIIVKKKEE